MITNRGKQTFFAFAVICTVLFNSIFNFAFTLDVAANTESLPAEKQQTQEAAAPEAKEASWSVNTDGTLSPAQTVDTAVKTDTAVTTDTAAVLPETSKGIDGDIKNGSENTRVPEKTGSTA